jgi:hypothetical protein
MSRLFDALDATELHQERIARYGMLALLPTFAMGKLILWISL